MRFFVIPYWVGYLAALILWITVVYLYFYKPIIKPRLENYFAQRRHDRRERNFYNRNSKKVQTYASARHRG